MLAVVQSLIRLTRAGSVKEFAEIIGGRVMALARAPILLSDSRWTVADLAALAADELARHRELKRSRVQIDGPPGTLAAPAAQALAMGLHELATNAVKFGGLAGDPGRLRLRWSRDAAGGLDLLWREQGGPAAVADGSGNETRGFGLSLIESAVRQQLCGSLETHQLPGGMEVPIRVPAEEVARI